MEKQKITPFLWFDDNAEEAVNFYTSVFEKSKKKEITHYDEAGAKASGRSKGSVMTGSFQIDGQEFVALNGGPAFKFNPSISFFVVFEDEKEVDNIWNKLVDGGIVLMEFGKYEWSEKYGWLQDKFGLSWQISLGKKKDVGGNTVSSSLLFVGDKFGKAKEAINFYKSIFKESEIEGIRENPDGTVMHAQFYLYGETFMAMDSNADHKFNFNEAVSFVVNCETQEEVDYFWNKLTADGGAEGMCGWLKDKFGVSWQVVPTILNKLLSDKDPKKSEKAMNAMLKMKKIDIKKLQED